MLPKGSPIPANRKRARVDFSIQILQQSLPDPISKPNDRRISLCEIDSRYGDILSNYFPCSNTIRNHKKIAYVVVAAAAAAVVVIIFYSLLGAPSRPDVFVAYDYIVPKLALQHGRNIFHCSATVAPVFIFRLVLCRVFARSKIPGLRVVNIPLDCIKPMNVQLAGGRGNGIFIENVANKQSVTGDEQQFTFLKPGDQLLRVSDVINVDNESG